MIYHFYDMYSGGRAKTAYAHILISAANHDAAIAAFVSRFGRDPYNETCGCCGEDYAVTEYETLEEATRFWRELLTPEAFLARSDVFFYEVSDA